MPLTAEQEDSLREYAKTLTDRELELLREFPPSSMVQTKPGVILLIPAPGVEGYVVGYTDDGLVMVVAPLTIPHPKYGWGDAEPGALAQADVDPAQLVLVRAEEITVEDVAGVLG